MLAREIALSLNLLGASCPLQYFMTSHKGFYKHAVGSEKNLPAGASASR